MKEKLTCICNLLPSAQAATSQIIKTAQRFMHQWKLKVPLTTWCNQWFLNLLQPVVIKISQESRRKIDEIAKTDQGAAKVGMENFGVLRDSTVS